MSEGLNPDFVISDDAETFTFDVTPLEREHVMRFSVDVSMRQLVESRFVKRELVDFVMKQLGNAITHKVEERVMSPAFDSLIDAAIRTSLVAEVKRVVTEHVNDKVDEFIGEVLS